MDRHQPLAAARQVTAHGAIGLLHRRRTTDGPEATPVRASNSGP